MTPKMNTSPNPDLSPLPEYYKKLECSVINLQSLRFVPCLPWQDCHEGIISILSAEFTSLPTLPAYYLFVKADSCGLYSSYAFFGVFIRLMAEAVTDS